MNHLDLLQIILIRSLILHNLDTHHIWQEENEELQHRCNSSNFKIININTDNLDLVLISECNNITHLDIATTVKLAIILSQKYKEVLLTISFQLLQQQYNLVILPFP